MKWNTLNDLQQLEHIIQASNDTPVMIFKHSTRCSISRTALDRLERSWKEEEVGHVKPYFLDLISFREVSNAIEHRLGVEHESPQMIILNNGKAVYHRSHFDIDYQKLREIVKN